MITKSTGVKAELYRAKEKIKYLNQDLLEKEQEIQLLEARLKEVPMYPSYHEEGFTVGIFKQPIKFHLYSFMYGIGLMGLIMCVGFLINKL